MSEFKLQPASFHVKGQFWGYGFPEDTAKCVRHMAQTAEGDMVFWMDFPEWKNSSEIICAPIYDGIVCFGEEGVFDPRGTEPEVWDAVRKHFGLD